MPDNKSPWGQGPKNSGGNKSPWGNGARPDRRRPKPGDSSPDLENVIQGFTKRVRNGGSNGGGGNNPLNKFGPLGMFVGIGVLALMLSSIYTVDQTEEALVLRLGKYQRTAAPGLNFKLPTPIESVITEETKVVKKVDIGDNSRASLMLTGDENIVDINFTVLWRISDLKNFVFEVDETPVAVRAVAESAMREVIGKNKLEEIITTGRLDITLAVRDLMQESNLSATLLTRRKMQKRKSTKRQLLKMTLFQKPAGKRPKSFKTLKPIKAALLLKPKVKRSVLVLSLKNILQRRA